MTVSTKTILVCGGRDYNDGSALHGALSTLVQVLGGHEKVVIIHGDATGADRMAGRWAENKGIRCYAFPAEWDRYGHSAGPMRNKEMLQEDPYVVLAFPGGNGTAHMVRIAREAGVRVIEVK